jgi:hypothetical protein
MEKGDASHGDRPTSPASTNAWSTMETLRAVSPETGSLHTVRGETRDGNYNINSVLESGEEGYEMRETRPTTSASQNPWSTSATLPVHNQDGSVEERGEGQPAHTTPDPWSTSATLPVMAEDGFEGKAEGEDGEEAKNAGEAQTEGEATTETAAAPRKEKKKLSLIREEHKKSFKHFLVRRYCFYGWVGC